uniref:Uncharacterized protein n=1 Tax=Arundo donax TaxID=35708 RepID=A0A0A9AL15_ARUDO
MPLVSGHAKNQSPAPMARAAGSRVSSPTASEPQNQGWISTAPSSGRAAPPPWLTMSGWMARWWQMLAPALSPATKTRARSPCAATQGSAAESVHMSAARQSS